MVLVIGVKTKVLLGMRMRHINDCLAIQSIVGCRDRSYDGRSSSLATAQHRFANCAISDLRFYECDEGIGRNDQNDGERQSSVESRGCTQAGPSSCQILFQHFPMFNVLFCHERSDSVKTS